MNKPTIAIIGAGNMGCSVIDGLIRTGYPAEKLWVTSPHLEENATWLANYPKLNHTTDNIQAVKVADIVVLAVKPLQIRPVCQEIHDTVAKTHPLIISLAAGMRSKTLEKCLPKQIPIVRAMPNLAARVGASATGLFKNAEVTDTARDQAESLLRSIGIVTWCSDESHLDIVTAIAGSGPAYFFYLMEIMETTAIAMGLSQEQARILIMQTAEGAAKVAMTANESPEALRARVTSKGGTTAAAFDFLTQPVFRDTLQCALESARTRANAIGNELE